MKNFGAPRTPPPPKILYVWAFSCVFKRKEAPNIKNLWGSGVPCGGGLGGGFLAKLFMFMPFSGPEMWLQVSLNILFCPAEPLLQYPCRTQSPKLKLFVGPCPQILALEKRVDFDGGHNHSVSAIGF